MEYKIKLSQDEINTIRKCFQEIYEREYLYSSEFIAKIESIDGEFMDLLCH